MFDGFGKFNPRKMPAHLFFGALHIDYSTAVRADISKQDFSVCPRHWYVDAAFRCARCGRSFVFSAEEQRFWYEELCFYIDSRAKHCRECRHDIRELKALRQEYNRDVASTCGRDIKIKEKERLLAVINALEAGGISLGGKVDGVRRTLTRQIERGRHSGAG